MVRQSGTCLLCVVVCNELKSRCGLVVPCPQEAFFFLLPRDSPLPNMISPFVFFVSAKAKVHSTVSCGQILIQVCVLRRMSTDLHVLQLWFECLNGVLYPPPWMKVGQCSVWWSLFSSRPYSFHVPAHGQSYVGIFTIVYLWLNGHLSGKISCTYSRMNIVAKVCKNFSHVCKERPASAKQ